MKQLVGGTAEIDFRSFGATLKIRGSWVKGSGVRALMQGP